MRCTVFICAAVALSASAGSAYAVDPSGSATFAVAESTKVPGLTLKPGTYSIRVVDHLSDRLIVRVDDQSGSTHSTFIGVQNSDMPQPSVPGAVTWSSKTAGTAAMRGFEFPDGGPVVEFVYPKDDAVAIAKVNSAKVPAIDPASEGKVADPSLSKDDMEVVSLWMLSSTQVGPTSAQKPAIAAEKFQPVVAATAPTPASAPAPAPATAPTPVASAPPPPQEVATASVPPSPAVQATPAVQAAPAAKPHKAVVAKLPKTASELPLLYLLGIASLLGAAGLRLRRALAGER